MKLSNAITTQTFKTFMISTLTASLLLGCYVPPHSQSEYPGKPHPQIHRPDLILEGSKLDHDHNANPSSHHNERIAGHYSRKLINNVNSNDSNEVVVHVQQASFMHPAQQILLSVSMAPDPLRHDPKYANGDNSLSASSYSPACDYRGTAELMGQDALHGLIYTIPVEGLGNDQNQVTSSLTTFKDGTQLNDKGLVFLRFKEGTLSIDSNNPNAFNTLCSGNLSLKGDYTKLSYVNPLHIRGQ